MRYVPGRHITAHARSNHVSMFSKVRLIKTLIKIYPLFFTGHKLRPLGIGVEAPKITAFEFPNKFCFLQCFHDADALRIDIFKVERIFGTLCICSVYHFLIQSRMKVNESKNTA